jgi:hypothetical protein
MAKARAHNPGFSVLVEGVRGWRTGSLKPTLLLLEAE